jgi:hypothetical protein
MILAGSGGNSGGLCCGQHLHNHGFMVWLVLNHEADALTGAIGSQFHILPVAGVRAVGGGFQTRPLHRLRTRSAEQRLPWMRSSDTGCAVFPRKGQLNSSNCAITTPCMSCPWKFHPDSTLPRANHAAPLRSLSGP